MRSTRLYPLSVCAVFALAACRPDARSEPHRSVTPPVESPIAIPDAPVSGSVRGAPFVVHDARYIVDRRVGYEHTDIKLSEGKAASPCGPIAPSNAPSVWLRLEGTEKMTSQIFRIAQQTEDAAAKSTSADSGSGSASSWSVHYQVFDSAQRQWVGVSDASALVTMHEPGADGRLHGGLAVCFSDEAKSCVSGSFDAQSCPSSIDQPVRGAQPPETIPEKYRFILSDAAAPPPPAPAAPRASTTHLPLVGR